MMFWTRTGSRILASLILGGALVSLGAQESPGLGYRDDWVGTRSNPAAAGFDRASGFYASAVVPEEAWTDSSVPLARWSLGGASRFAAWTLGEEGGRKSLRQAFVFPWSSTFSSAVDATFDLSKAGSWETEDWGLSAMARPFSGLSLGLDLRRPGDADAVYSAGAGLRPLYFLGEAGSALTLFGDARWVAGAARPELTALGAELKAGKNLDVSLAWNPTDELVSLSLSLSGGFSRLGALSQGQDAAALTQEPELWTGIAARFAPSPFAASGTVVLSLGGEVAEASRPGFFWGPQPRQLLRLVESLDELTKDPKVTSLALVDTNFIVGTGQLDDLHRALSRFKAAGKSLVWYNQYYNTPTYLLAAAHADKVFMGPLGTVDLRSPALQSVFLRDALEFVGIRVYNFRSHPAKAAGNEYTETAMTAEERENKTRLVQGIQDWFVSLVNGRSALDGRGDEVISLGPWLQADLALESGLVDELLYPDQWEDWLKSQGRRINPPVPRDLLVQTDWGPGPRTETVALVPMVGAIGMESEPWSDGIDPEAYTTLLRSLGDNPRYKAVVLRIDSPGGSAQGSDLLAREIARLASRKPVYVSMGNVAASGGYYIAAPATRIFASPATVTGSIGVLSLVPTGEGLLKKLRLHEETVSGGGSGDFGNFFRDLSPEEEAKWQESTAFYYRQFVKVVSEHRDMSTEEVDEVARGQVWTGADAMDHGLVDDLGGLSASLDALREALGAESLQVEVERPGTPGMGLGSSLARMVAGEKLMALVDRFSELEALSQGGHLYLHDGVVEPR